MIYVGIDIAKTNHYASIVNHSTGEVLESPFLVTNTFILPCMIYIVSYKRDFVFNTD